MPNTNENESDRTFLRWKVYIIERQTKDSGNELAAGDDIVKK